GILARKLTIGSASGNTLIILIRLKKTSPCFFNRLTFLPGFRTNTAYSSNKVSGVNLNPKGLPQAHAKESNKLLITF
ncbi:MAG TPA: hypothetical protein PKL81_12920, partial [Ferruginibacter sp.]|nr:hypothetical protein [Ferruginibacter sp.]HNP00287.1 hypothetical protein [Ferruginibacter sp.]